jgi:hypothetical protein
MQTVKPRELVILKLYLGLPITPFEWQNSELKSNSGITWKDIPKQKHTYIVIGSYLGISQEKVRKLKNLALLKLKFTQDYIDNKTIIRIINVGSIPRLPLAKAVDNLKNQCKKRNKTKTLKLIQKPISVTNCAIELDTIRANNNICDEIMIATILTLIYSRLNSEKIFLIPQMPPICEVITSLKLNRYNLGKRATIKNSVSLIMIFKSLYLHCSTLHCSKHNNFRIAVNYLCHNPQILSELIT